MTLAAARQLPRHRAAPRKRSPYGIPRSPSSLFPSIPTTSLLLGSSTFAPSLGSRLIFILLLLRNQGFFCADCPKLFFGKTPAPPAPSPAPGGGRKRAARGLMSPSTLFQMITKERRSRRRASTPADGIKIRGRWSASCMYPFTTRHLTF